MTATNLTTYLIEPKAPLIIRSGRPFDAQAGADRARFPPPSTLAGTLRTAYALDNGKELNVNLAEIPVWGPLPALLTELGEFDQLLVPKPANAHYLVEQETRKPYLIQASPKALLENEEGCDLPTGMLPLQLSRDVKGKPISGPLWWSFNDFLQWHTKDQSELTYKTVSENGWTPPADDLRTHVSINREKLSAADGQLFQTAGLNFWQPHHGNNLSQQKHYPERAIGLLGGIAGNIDSNVITLGGERRLSGIKQVSDAIPALDAKLASKLTNASGISLTLLTPALFGDGWKPSWLNDQLEGEPPGCKGLRLKLKAAAVERWLPHSGWDLAHNKAKAGRKLVPAGATYWFEVLACEDPTSLTRLWFHSICDQAQDRLDGFGLAIIQPWTAV